MNASQSPLQTVDQTLHSSAATLIEENIVGRRTLPLPMSVTERRGRDPRQLNHRTAQSMPVFGDIVQRPVVIKHATGRADSMRRTGQIRLASDYEGLARDVLPVFEAAVLPVTAYMCAILFDGVVPAVWYDRTATSLTGLAVIGAALSSVILRESHTKPPGASIASLHGLIGLATRLAGLFALLGVVGPLTGLDAGRSAAFYVAWSTLALLTLVLCRALFAAHLKALRRHGLLRERVAVVWAGRKPTDAPEYPIGDHQCAMEVVGTYHDAVVDQTNHATLDDLMELAKEQPIDRVIVVADHVISNRLAATVRVLKALDVDITLAIPGIGGTGSDLAGSLGMPLIKRPIRGWDRVSKIAVDRLIATLVLLPALIVMAIVAVAIRLDTRGPVLFRQSRHGWNNTEFQVLKFRTMEWRDAADASGAEQTRRNDVRVTRIGRFLRKSSLDELPQLFNVLRGEMSIVGPRPHPVAMRTEDRLCHEITSEYPHRHRVKPGLTGLAQINGCRGPTETAGMLRRRIEYDNAYIDGWSMYLDLKILALTPLRLVWHGGTAF
jgi:exopolysaccharide biosynthesis polyprenyl glycosylphosphotransferase